MGSTRAMHDLRSRVERIARTDFTVLLEGGNGAEVEAEFRPRFASVTGRRAVAGAGHSSSVTLGRLVGQLPTVNRFRSTTA